MSNTHTPEFKRSAQEILDGLGDYVTSENKVNQDITGPYRYGGQPIPVTPVASVHRPIDGDRPCLATNPMAVGLDIFKQEVEDRRLLAKAKVGAKATVGDTEMTVAEMEHRRKLIPKYIEFLKAYLVVLQRAESERDRRLDQAKKEGEQMAKEALASLGTSKAAGEAATFVKTLQASHLRDNQFDLVLQHQHARQRAESMLEQLEEQLGLIDSAKTNANSAIVEPFEDVPPTPTVEEGKPKKTVQEILCESTPGPASIYSKLAKMTKGLLASTDPSAPGSYLIAGVKGPGLPKVELYGKDILQRFHDMYETLIRYQTAMDRFNLEVSFVGGDGNTWIMQDELVRKEQCGRFVTFLTALESSHSKAETNFKAYQKGVEQEVERRTKQLERTHEKEDKIAARIHVETNNQRALDRIKSEPTESEQATLDAQIQLEKAQEAARKRKQDGEKATLTAELDEYRKMHTPELILCPEFDLAALKNLRVDYDANMRVNQRRRAPANAQKWVMCESI
jgi:hypothetical protein